ncbi:MAG: hypothetical protein JW982_09830 [Spirochaetes bacterium]|nr:hypothetical protein [Spirochaetota bacterium]
MRKNIFLILIFFLSTDLFCSTGISTAFHDNSEFDNDKKDSWIDTIFEFSSDGKMTLSFYDYFNMISFQNTTKTYLNIENDKSHIRFFAGDFFINHGAQTAAGNLDGKNASSINVMSVDLFKIFKDTSNSEKNFHGAGISFPLIYNPSIYLINTVTYSNTSVYPEKINNRHIPQSLDEIIFKRTPDPERTDHITCNTIMNCTEITYLKKFTVAALYSSVWITDNGRKISWEDGTGLKTDLYNNLSILLKITLDNFLCFYEISILNPDTEFISGKQTIYCTGFKFSSKITNTELILKKRGGNYYSPFSREIGTDTDHHYLRLLNDIRINRFIRFSMIETAEKKIYTDNSYNYVISNSENITLAYNNFEISVRSRQQKKSEDADCSQNNYISIKYSLFKNLIFSGNTGMEGIKKSPGFYEIAVSVRSKEKLSFRSALFEKKHEKAYIRQTNEFTYKITGNNNFTLSESAYFKEKKLSGLNLNFALKMSF